jgi:uncharacterized membrane protein
MSITDKKANRFTSKLLLIGNTILAWPPLFYGSFNLLQDVAIAAFAFIT